jgi:tyrosyl-tRNA synthetase
VTFVIGTFTTLIGDPSDRDEARAMALQEKILVNAKSYAEQAFKILDRSKTSVVYNYDWLSKLTFTDVISMASCFTVQQFMARDRIRNRYEKNDPIWLREFLYPLAQGYDAVHLKTDVQLGATEQLFNLMAGRRLQEAFGQKPLICLTFPVLVGTDGVDRMSKSRGNYIGIAETPENIYGKTMSIPDNIILQYFELLTNTSDEELADFKKQLESGVNPMSLKKSLAKELVTQFYSVKDAQAAEEHFEKTVQNKEVPDEISQVVTADYLEKIKILTMKDQGGVSGSHWEGEPPEWSIPIHVLLFDHKLAKSRSEANRLISQGAISVNGKRVNVSKNTDIGKNIVRLKIGDVIKIGKRNYIKVVER